MILLDDKRTPPPPYPPAAPTRRADAHTVSTLPPHILLHIVEATFPPYAHIGSREAYRRNLYWLTVGLRLVCRGLYIACMHTLRSTYVGMYLSLVKKPYTSDPFPLVSEASDSGPPSALLPIQSLHRETEVLDLFIALKAREDVWLDETDLHLEREESFKDIFALMQPRRRVEDLLRYYGIRYGVITLSDPPSSGSTRIPFSCISISFSPRKVGLALLTHPTKSGTPCKRNSIIECSRDRGEQLEVVAKRLAKELVRWIVNK